MKYTESLQPKLMEIPDYYTIPSNIHNNLGSIQNLNPNTFYILNFNNLELKFLSDENGILYFNNCRDTLPIALLPYNNIGIKFENKSTFKKVPIGVYYSYPSYIDNINKYLEQKIFITFKLTITMIKSNSMKHIHRKMLIQNGKISFADNPVNPPGIYN